MTSISSTIPPPGTTRTSRRSDGPTRKYGQFQWQDSTGRSDYLALSTGLTRRFRDNFQFNLTHTLMFYKHDNHQGAYSFTTFGDNQFDIDDDWARSTDFQRNTLRAERPVSPPARHFNLSAAYFFGSGSYVGHDHRRAAVRQAWDEPAERRRADHGQGRGARPLSKDRRSSAGSRPRPATRSRGCRCTRSTCGSARNSGSGALRVSGVAEVFNLFNHANFGSYNGQVNSTTFGDVRQSTGNAYVPRSGQFGFTSVVLRGNRHAQHETHPASGGNAHVGRHGSALAWPVRAFFRPAPRSTSPPRATAATS